MVITRGTVRWVEAEEGKRRINSDEKGLDFGW